MDETEIEKAAQLTDDELQFVNSTCESLFSEESRRPLVYVALCAHIIGCVVYGSDGALTKDVMVDLVRDTIQV